MFKKGDKVRLIENEDNRQAIGERHFGVVHIVKHDLGGVDRFGMLHFEEGTLDNGWYAYRFELVEAAQPEFKVGDMVRVKADDDHPSPKFIRGSVHEVAKAPHMYMGNLCITLKDHIGAQHDNTYLVSRFELANKGAIIQAPVALTKENAKVGMEVVLHNANGHFHAEAIKGKVVVISDMRPETVRVTLNGEEVKGAFKFERFHFVPKAQPIGPGSKLVVIEAHRDSGLRADKVVTLKKIHPNGALYLLEEYPGYYAKRRFAPVGGVAAPKPVVEKPLAAGDNVYVTSGDSDMVNDGIARPIYMINHNGAYFLDEGVYVPLKHLVRATAANKPPPKPPYAGDLRVDLRAKAGNGSAICKYAFVVDGVRAKFELTPPCYASLGRTGGPISQLVVDTSYHKGRHAKFSLVYLDWLLNKSPWAVCFLTKDPQDALDKGVALDCNRHIGELVGAATALREATEFEQRNATFQWAIDNGFDGNVAYLLGCSYFLEGKKFTHSPATGGHQAITTAIRHDDLMSFFANGYKKTEEKPANKKCGGYKVHVWIGKTDGVSTYWDFVLKNDKHTIRGAGWQAEKSVTEENVKAFGLLLKEQIEKAKK